MLIFLPTAQLIYNPDKKYRSVAMVVQDLNTEEANEEFNTRLRTNLSQTMILILRIRKVCG